MPALDEYQLRCQRARLRREDGILEVTLHRDGGSLVWDEPAHRELPELFYDIAGDPQNRVVILTGTGEDFCARVDSAGWADAGTPTGWDKLYFEGKRLLQNHLDVAVPMIAAVNGPARVHAELAVLCDIVLASPTACFQDAAHFPRGAVPGDGVHVVWPLLLGINRARYFLLRGQEIGAEEARSLGMVGEVLPAAELLPRAWEIAREMAAHSDLALRYTRVVLTQHIKRLMLADVGYGLALEGAAGRR